MTKPKLNLDDYSTEEIRALLEQRLQSTQKAEDLKRVAEIDEFLVSLEAEKKELLAKHDLTDVKPIRTPYEVKRGNSRARAKAQRDALYQARVAEAAVWVRKNAVRYGTGAVKIGNTAAAGIKKFSIKRKDMMTVINNFINS